MEAQIAVGDLVMYRAFLTLLFFASTAVAADPKNQLIIKDSKFEQAMIDVINAERKDKKLPKLTLNVQLREAARDHAGNMAKREKLEHELDGVTTEDRIKKAHYKYELWSQSIAINPTKEVRVVSVPSDGSQAVTYSTWVPKDMKETLKDWLKTDMRDNILSDKYTEICSSAAVNEKGHVYWCLLFGKPKK